MSESSKSNAEVAAYIAWNCGAQEGESPDVLTFNRGLLVSEIESALSTAQSNLAREVLKDVHRNRNCAAHTIETRLRDLFTRLNIQVEE